MGNTESNVFISYKFKVALSILPKTTTIIVKKLDLGEVRPNLEHLHHHSDIKIFLYQLCSRNHKYLYKT